MHTALLNLLSLATPVRRTIRVDGVERVFWAQGSAGGFFHGGRNEDAVPDNFVRGWVASLIESTRARRTSGLFTPRGCEASVIANTSAAENEKNL